ncbi:DUF423 domain-containing protein [Aquibium sp. ELW1220]|uniref:DUF423 domain-containing protein n=1 Tax=Aquibium sp. ELW1220 TaxID=2976766 RepID=UPI0025AF4BD3|nr:DUF423 domain-containing protein [Aquibium sp. ELW1220]MDN2579886.1 DUF423 domain-containing protein [Aquibium sp. ELW1220]
MALARILAAGGGLSGAGGVALSAAAAHAGGANTGTAASFLLMHAGAFLAVGLTRSSRPMRIGATVVLVGLALFAGDLLMRDFAGMRLFPMAAPIGGSLMILGWLAVAVTGAIPRSRPAG